MSSNLPGSRGRRRVAIASIIIVMIAFAGSAVDAIAGPSIYKQSVTIRAWRFTSYWRNQKADSPEWDTWSWVPQLSFQLHGPIAGGSQLRVEYSFPDGKPWFWHNLPTPELEADRWSVVATGSENRDLYEKMATLVTGQFGYTISMTNELSGTNEVLMKGKFKVGKVHVGIASRPHEFEYYVDQDWRLPIGQVWLDVGEDETSPPINIGVWLRGKWLNSKLTGYLMYNGKAISNTDIDGGGVGRDIELLTVGNRDEDPAWTRAVCTYYTVRGKRGSSLVDGIHYLSENPGEYELKLLYSGKLVRALKFTVGPDGSIVDSGVGTEPHPQGTLYLAPVKIVGDLDGKWDKNAWKSDAYYGNPYAGFEAIPPGSN